MATKKVIQVYGLFDDDKMVISLSGVGSIELTDETSTVSTSEYNIIKLKKKEFWYSYV